MRLSQIHNSRDPNEKLERLIIREGFTSILIVQSEVRKRKVIHLRFFGFLNN